MPFTEPPSTESWFIVSIDSKEIIYGASFEERSVQRPFGKIDYYRAKLPLYLTFLCPFYTRRTKKSDF